MITFTIYGNPVAQGRPRAFIPKGQQGKWKHPIVTDPPNSREWKRFVKTQALGYKPDELHDGSIQLILDFFFLRPKSLPKKVTNHIKRPDIENLAKAILDALKGIFYRDDSQVNLLIARKKYCEEKEQPRVEVLIGHDG